LEFLKGGTLQIDHSIMPAFKPDEIAHRVLRLVGTNLRKYNLFSFNCEHFTTWCATDELQSKQVSKGFTIAGIALTATTIALFLKSQLDKKDLSKDSSYVTDTPH
jgi:hypothetical protein